MRQICSIIAGVALSAALSASFAADVSARPLDDCHKPPPAWYTAPRLTHTYSVSYGSGYARASTHEYSAQRRSYSYQAEPSRSYSYSSNRRFHDPFGR